MRDYLGFFGLLILILLTFALVWFGLRNYGLSKPVSDYKTPLVEKLLEDAKGHSLIWSPNHSETLPLIYAEFESKSWVNKQTGAPLEQTLENLKSNTSPLLLFFSGPSALALPQLRKLMKKNNLWEKTIFCSRFDGLLKDLRELEPQWTFCSGEIFMTRLLAISSLGLSSLIPIGADVVFIHTAATSLKPEDMQPIVDEGKRQNKVVLIGPVTRPLDGIFPHGWMVEQGDQKAE